MRLTKTLAAIPLALFCLSILSGCNGASGDNEPENTGEYSLSMSYKTLVNGKCAEPTSELSFPADTGFCAVANLKQGGSQSSGKLIGFGATLGELSSTTRLTENGVAQVIVTNAAGTLEAGTITASFTEGETDIAASRNYQFTAGTTPGEETPTLTTLIISGAENVTRFKVDETVQLQAQFLDSQNRAISGQKVSFSAGTASLIPSTALTKDNGIAQVSYTPGENELGVASFSATIEYAGQSYQSTSQYEVLAKDAVGDEGILKLGYFDGEQFIEGQLGTSLTAQADGSYKISAGGSFGVTATLVSQDSDGKLTRVQSPSSIGFTSDCTAGNNASLDSPVTTLSGSASSTFQDTSCSGNSERDDQIIATTLAGNQTLSATLSFTLARQTLASLSFISAEPKNIRIKGAGGTGSSESSLVTFKVISANGQPAAQQEVSFELDTLVGGLSFSNGKSTHKSLTNAEGLASVRVLAGTVPTPVRVVATAIDTDTHEAVSSQSEQLTVNTGLPQQLSFSLSTSIFNPEAADYDGEKATITAYAADSFANPAPDDTTINFTSEGGQIVPSCLTVNGSCSVQWTSANARVPDHRITVLAYALGHETFFDTNGNNQFDDADGTAIPQACLDSKGDATACSGNGMDIETYHANGFSDLGDAFRDDDESDSYDLGEPYFNTLANDEYSPADGKFNGPQCSGSLCGEGQANKTYIRKALIMTMSGSSAHFEILQDGVQIYTDGQQGGINANAIPAGGSSRFSVRFFDSAGQIMPADTSLNVSSTQGELSFEPFSVPNRTQAGGSATGFSITNDIDAASTGEPAKTTSISIDVTTPKNNKTSIGFGVVLTGT